MLWFQQQQAQLNAANANTTQNSSDGSPSSVQGVSGTNAGASSLFSGQTSFGTDSLLTLLQSQQVVSPSSTATTSDQSNGQASTFQQDFQSLVSAISSGNLSQAQQAYATLTQLQTGNGTSSSSSTSSASSAPQNGFQQALSQIGSDLQSGNITGAQQTLASLQQSHEGGGHHHHHGGGGGGGGGDLASLLGGGSSASSSSSSSSSSTTTQPVVVTNADGSVTTTTTNADGSVTVTTTSPTQTAANSSDTALQAILAALNQMGTI
jgi:hypothetical protein